METPTVPHPADSPRAPDPPAEPASTQVPGTGSLDREALSEMSHTTAPYAPPGAPFPSAPMPPGNNTPWIVGGVVAAILLIGLVATPLIALLAGLALGGGIGTMRSSISTQSFQVQGTPTIVVNDTAGNVQIHAGQGSTVTVQITKHVRAVDNAVAQQAFASIGANAAQQGNTITITSTFTSAGMGAMMQGRSVDYAITLPAGSAVQADVATGNMDVANTTGTLALTTHAGNITVTNVTFGPSSVLRTSAGNVNASGGLAPGASLEVRVTAGNVTLTLPASTATHLTADVSVGNLTVTGFPVPVSQNGYTGHHASGDTGANPQGSVSAGVSTGNVTIVAR